MNAVIEAIRKRRSIRSYHSLPIPRDLINAIIDAGNEAPSAMNSQPWRFVVVEDKATKSKLLRAARPGAEKLFDSLRETNPERYEMIIQRFRELDDPIYYTAPVIIFVIGEGRYAGHSCPLACENMMLAAYSLGLGSCWVGLGSMVTDDEEVKQILQLKDDETIFGPILIGYPKEYPERPPKNDATVKWLA
jgi:nitroreductase